MPLPPRNSEKLAVGNQEARLHQNLTVLAPQSWTFSLQNHEKAMCVAISYPAYEVFVIAAQTD